MKTNKKSERTKRIYYKLMQIGNRAGCHQRADRSFFFRGYQFPICARCTGVFLGYILTFPSIMYFGIDVEAFIACCIVMFLDWFLQYKKIKESTNLRRLITGILGGIGVLGVQISLLVKALLLCGIVK